VIGISVPERLDDQPFDSSVDVRDERAVLLRFCCERLANFVVDERIGFLNCGQSRLQKLLASSRDRLIGGSCPDNAMPLSR
jgi:hypothetical protein